MLPTFVIGLREGLEAALIVSIVAAFLRRHRVSLRGMWLGVVAGVALSIAVGVVLKLIEQGLPQAQQEGMETVIGAIAVFFVTGMVLWMRTHARFMKRELEEAAAAALKDGTTTALAVMAFLAVLREGFETSVFLLATFQNAGSAPAAVWGAVLGIVAAIGLGWGIFAGGVRLNLQRFFKVTGVFLVLVAAGLVLLAFRTAHEAGWVNVGQGSTVDLGWLTPAGSVRSALVTGVLGIPSDPRVIEVVAWFCYLVPMMALMLWPAAAKPSPALAQRLRVGGAVAAVVAGVVLALTVSRPQPAVSTEAPVAGGGTAAVSLGSGSATLVRGGQTISLGDPKPTTAGGADTQWTATHVAGDLPSTVDLKTLVRYDGGRIPSGLSVSTAPGPYDARWTDDTALTVLTRGNGLVDARETGRLTLTYSGGGLTTPRILTVDGWQVSPSYVSATSAAIADTEAIARDRVLWKAWVPVFLGAVALGLLAQALRTRSRRDAAAPVPAQTPAPEGTTTHARSQA